MNEFLAVFGAGMGVDVGGQDVTDLPVCLHFFPTRWPGGTGGLRSARAGSDRL